MRKGIAFALLILNTSLAMGSNSESNILFLIAIPMDDSSDEVMGHAHAVICYAVIESGVCSSWRSTSLGSKGTRPLKLTQAQIVRATNIVSSLPDSRVDLPKSETVVVTRHIANPQKPLVFDRRKLPPQMKELFELLGGFRFAELDDRIGFDLEQSGGDSVADAASSKLPEEAPP